MPNPANEVPARAVGIWLRVSTGDQVRGIELGFRPQPPQGESVAERQRNFSVVMCTTERQACL